MLSRLKNNKPERKKSRTINIMRMHKVLDRNVKFLISAPKLIINAIIIKYMIMLIGSMFLNNDFFINPPSRVSFFVLILIYNVNRL
jgi:hypothetical protein